MIGDNIDQYRDLNIDPSSITKDDVLESIQRNFGQNRELSLEFSKEVYTGLKDQITKTYTNGDIENARTKF